MGWVNNSGWVSVLQGLYDRLAQRLASLEQVSREQGKGMHLSTDAYRSYVLRFWGGPPSTRGGVAFAISLGCILMAQAAHP